MVLPATAPSRLVESTLRHSFLIGSFHTSIVAAVFPGSWEKSDSGRGGYSQSEEQTTAEQRRHHYNIQVKTEASGSVPNLQILVTIWPSSEKTKNIIYPTKQNALIYTNNNPRPHSSFYILSILHPHEVTSYLNKSFCWEQTPLCVLWRMVQSTSALIRTCYFIPVSHSPLWC